MRYHELLGLDENVVLDEMPVSHYQTVGDFSKGSSFRKEPDRKLVTNPKAIQKLHTKLANGKFDLNLFFVNMPGMGKYVETGLVPSGDWVAQHMPKAWPEIQPNISSESINVIFTNNSATPHYPMTAWIVAHRIGHAIDRWTSERQDRGFADMTKTMEEYAARVFELYGVRLPKSYSSYYGGNDQRSSLPRRALLLRYFFEQIGTMKSARDRNLRDDGEFRHELCAQYLTSGKITFRPLGRSIVVGYSYGRPQYRSCAEGDVDYANSLVSSLAETVEDSFDTSIGQCVGRILVM
jgi:hypothetical protein